MLVIDFLSFLCPSPLLTQPVDNVSPYETSCTEHSSHNPAKRGPASCPSLHIGADRTLQNTEGKNTGRPALLVPHNNITTSPTLEAETTALFSADLWMLPFGGRGGCEVTGRARTLVHYIVTPHPLW